MIRPLGSGAHENPALAPTGENPVAQRLIYLGVAQSGSARDLGSRGRGFESLHSGQVGMDT